MIEVPHEVLSEHFQQRIHGRRLVSAVFTTFQFEPGFFEQEVLPVFFDLNLSHVPVIRLAQLEDALRASNAQVAVYYDANGLIPVDEISAKLDIVRVPVRHRTGIFHPKSVLALVEDIEQDEHGRHPRTLLVAAMSANLTRAGWWKNVEACHVEELPERGPSRLRTGLLDYIAAIRHRSPDDVDHAALDAIREFVLKTELHGHRTANGELHPHFFGGTQAFIDFLSETAGDELRGLNLEIISPFFDQDEESAPLLDLIRRFKPAEIRVLLPRDDAGAALVPPGLYRWVRDLEGVSWGTLPGALTRTSNRDAAVARTVHAKVYRFFQSQPKREYLVIGSVNLTRPAHLPGGNLESAILVQVAPPRRPQFWLEVDDKQPREFATADGADGDTAASTAGSRLVLRYDWANVEASAYWNDASASPRLQLSSGGVPLFDLEPLPQRTWHLLKPESTARLRDGLDSTALVQVRGDREHDVMILVLEDGMFKKPPLISKLSVHEIMKYWSLLTPERRNEFIAARLADLLADAVANPLVPRTPGTPVVSGIFERFAGIFHAFECLREAVKRALDSGREKDALYRLFGTKHDSLGPLLSQVRDEPERDLVDRYVIVLCARQLCDEVRRSYREFWTAHPRESAALESALGLADVLRAALERRDPEIAGFLAWFEQRFVVRATPVETTA